MGTEIRIATSKTRHFRAPFFQAGKWRVRYYLLADPTRKWKCTTLDGAKTWAAARKAINRFVREDKVEPVLSPESLGGALDRWMEEQEVRVVTAADYQRSVDLFKAKLGPEKLVKDITVEEVSAVFHSALSDLSSSTKLKYHGFLGRFWSWAVDRGLAAVNVVKKVKPAKAWLEDRRIAKEEAAHPLTIEEARKLLAECPVGGELRLTVHIGCLTGLRISNILGSEEKAGLCWGDVKLDAATLFIDRSRMKNRNPLAVPLHRELVAVLTERLKTLDHVPAAGEQIIHDRCVRKGFNSALKRAGLAPRRIHDLRTSFASWIAAEAPELITAVLLGHSKSTITRQYAMGQKVDVLRGWLDKLPGLLAPTGGPARIASDAV